MQRERIMLTFGFYDREAPHFTSIRDAFAREGWTFREVHTTAKGLLGKLRHLYRRWQSVAKGADSVFVVFPGHHLVPFVWLLTRFPRKTIYFEALISLYDTNVFDRVLAKPGTVKSWMLWLTDWLSCHLADTVIIDTEEHKKYFVEEFHLNPKKVRVIYLGSRRDLIPPRIPPTGPEFDAFFYGTYIPLQGVEYIIDAAAIVEKQNPAVRFTLVGGGQTEKAIKKRAEDLQLTNMTFQPFMPFPELMKRLSRADLSLGIFGTTPKAGRVIPHKVVDAVEAGVPQITRDSPAIRERYANHPLVTLCPPGDGEALAKKILEHATLAMRGRSPSANSPTHP